MPVFHSRERIPWLVVLFLPLLKASHHLAFCAVYVYHGVGPPRLLITRAVKLKRKRVVTRMNDVTKGGGFFSPPFRLIFPREHVPRYSSFRKSSIKQAPFSAAEIAFARGQRRENNKQLTFRLAIGLIIQRNFTFVWHNIASFFPMEIFWPRARFSTGNKIKHIVSRMYSGQTLRLFMLTKYHAFCCRLFFIFVDLSASVARRVEWIIGQ